MIPIVLLGDGLFEYACKENGMLLAMEEYTGVEVDEHVMNNLKATMDSQFPDVKVSINQSYSNADIKKN